MNSSAAPTEAKSETKRPFNPYPAWSPRFWHGMRFGDWMKLWAGHGFRTHPLRAGMAAILTLYTPTNTVLGWLQSLRYGRRLDETEIAKPPVFIVGHWRSGTTFLHELMFLDERFGSPTTYQCFAPHHFLVTEWLFPKIFAYILPKQRPMDNMEMGWDRPQEDEFALLTLAAPTPYFRMAYPNDPPPYDEFLDMDGVAPADLARFQKLLEHFVKTLTLRTGGKQILLKSPPHTGRVGVLAKMFPGAKFVHITRNPYSLFSSTERLWDALDEAQGFYYPKDVNGSRREYVFHCLERMYGGFERQRKELAPGQIHDLKYESLVADPLGELSKIYEQLDLGDFEAVRPKVAELLAQRKDYRTNVHKLDDGLKTEIRRRWSDYFERYGYE